MGPCDARQGHADFKVLIEKENKVLLGQQVFGKVRVARDRRTGLNVLRPRNFLAYKNVGMLGQYAMARLLVQAMRRLKVGTRLPFTLSPLLAKTNSRLFLALAATMNLSVATRDDLQAYVCTTHPFLRSVYIIRHQTPGLTRISCGYSGDHCTPAGF